MYAAYKPLRNYLRGFNLWTGLGAVYFYMQHLGFNEPLPPQLQTPKLRLGQSPHRAGLFPHLVELMARELVLNADQRFGNPFRTATEAFKTMSLIHRLDDRYWGSYDNRSDDIIRHLSRLAFQQFPSQSPIATGELARHKMLYTHPRVAPMIEAEFGMSTGELFQIILLLAEELSHGPTPPFAFLHHVPDTMQDAATSLRARISKSGTELREILAARQSFGVNWAFSFNAMRQYPLIHAGNPASVICPSPTMLIRRLSDGLYFDLISADKGFGDAVGKSFEDYVGEAAEKIGERWLELLPEQTWGSPEKRSIDWIMSDNSGTMFVECKLARLSIASQTDLADSPALSKSLERLAGHIGQTYATLTDALNGQYPHWKNDGRPIHPVVVTFYEWFHFGPFLHSALHPLVVEELARRELDASLLERHPFTVCSISEFEA